MEDLIGALLLATLFGVLVACAIALAVAVMAVTALGCSGWALLVGVSSFTGAFAPAVAERGGARRAPRDPEPAFELYVLGGLFSDYRHSLQHAASEMAGVRGELAGHAAKWQKGATIPLAIGAIVGGYLGTAAAAAVGVLVGATVALVAAVTWTFSWALILALRGADAIRRRVRHASYECPTDHERFSLPVYVCPACGAEHARLVPGRWGIFKRECRCGQTALPTTVIGGRQKVPQQCPSGHFMSGFLGFAENLPVAIVGGPSSGKSSFLAGALMELDRPDSGVCLEVLKESRAAYARLLDSMNDGAPPQKTTEERQPALVAEVQGSGRSRALYAYDVAGEVYGAEDKVRGLRFLARSAGIAMLVDPFSISRVAAEKEQDLAEQAQSILPSSEPPDDVLARLLGTLEEAGIDTQKMPLAVILAKVDACGIEQEIAELAQAEGGNEGARAWLEANGAGNLVRTIEQHFKQVGWFAASALGRMPDPQDSTPFSPRGAVEPLLWILARRDVHPSADGASATHTAQRLVGEAADFPLPSPAARTRRAVVAACAATALIVVPPTVFAATGSPTPAGVPGYNATAAEQSSSSGEASGSSGSSAGAPQQSTAPPAPPPPPAPVRAIETHYHRLDDGDYDGAFAMFTPEYRAQNPSWAAYRRIADPMVNIVSVGTPQVSGGQARVPIVFYARDRHPSPDSDTICRHFAGTAELLLTSEGWRFDPAGTRYTATETPGNPGCHP
jgi:Double-GTPase 2